jgi:hypothetical protein
MSNKSSTNDIRNLKIEVGCRRKYQESKQLILKPKIKDDQHMKILTDTMYIYIQMLNTNIPLPKKHATKLYIMMV